MGLRVLKNLIRSHSIKVPAGVEYLIEQCSLTVGEVVGCENLEAIFVITRAKQMGPKCRHRLEQWFPTGGISN